jgi:hypothetical protein
MSRAGDIGVTMKKTIPARDYVGHACTKKSVARKAWATVAVIAKCADDYVNEPD